MNPIAYSNVIEIHEPLKLGTAEIVHDSPSHFERMMGSLNGQPLRREKYCRLLVNGNVMMTDAEFERRTNLEAIRNCKGHALIAGLGIGLILEPFCQQCSAVTVVEKNKDVIALVGPKFPSVQVIHADIHLWTPEKGQKFDTIYFDIWADVSSDDAKTARSLKRRFKKYLNTGGWIGDWATQALRLSPRRI